MRWSAYWTKSFADGRHVDGHRGGELVARVFALDRISGVPIMPHASGRTRRLYLAMACLRGAWAVVGVYGTSWSAKRACERTLEEATS